MDMILIAGLWLDGSAWDDVVPRLRDLGHHPVPISLPGQGAPPANATLNDQHAAVVAGIDAAAGPVMVVGHSAASTLAWMALDARPHKVTRVVMIGGFPSGDGDSYADFFPVVDGAVPFPGWEPFDGPDSADLDEQQRGAIAGRALKVPEGVVKGIVHLGDERRFGVPVTLICPEFTPAQAKEWIDGGEVAELARSGRVDFVDIDSGHWPMFTQPTVLADLLDRIANG
jgi:pimeloyl-ACP methyl ester carboxylesterase